MVRKYKWPKLDRETIVFILFLIGMAVYYGWRMFALTPWYDELYTYYYFISRGPVYAAIHWPLPNNHIGYSVLSACLGIFGNSAVALRGVSYLCSLGSLVLLFRIGRKCFDYGLALIPVFFYTGMKIVNQLAVQGRGYALVTFCYLAAVYELLYIISDKNIRFRHYLVFGLALVMALYAIPSSVYMVLSVCLIGGVVLLMRRKYGQLLRLVFTSVISAVCTTGLYGIVWLAIGSNLLVKTESSAYFGMGHGSVLRHAPFEALKTGIDYMLATPYIQSVSRKGYLGQLKNWLSSLLNEYYTGGAAILAVLLLISVILAIVCVSIKIKNGCYKKTVEDDLIIHTDFMEFYLSGSILLIPIMLIIQCALPYYRVFSFAGVTVAFAVTWLCQMLTRRHTGRRALTAVSLICGIFCVFKLLTPSYMAQYSAREAAIEDAYGHIDVTQAEKIAVTDCDQEYLLLFLYGRGEDRVTMQPEEGDIVLADKYLLLGYERRDDLSGDAWKLYLTPEQFEESGVTEQMETFYENSRFILYKHKENE